MVLNDPLLRNHSKTAASNILKLNHNNQNGMPKAGRIYKPHPSKNVSPTELKLDLSGIMPIHHHNDKNGKAGECDSDNDDNELDTNDNQDRLLSGEETLKTPRSYYSTSDLNRFLRNDNVWNEQNGDKNQNSNSASTNSNCLSSAQSIFFDEKLETKMKDDAKGAKKRKVKRYYDRQIDLIENYRTDNRFLNVFAKNALSSTKNQDGGESTDPGDFYTEESADKQRWESLLTKLSLFVNVLLFLAKIVAAVISGSLVVISSVVDSAMDLTTGLVMFCTNRAIKNRNLHKYPRGRTRLEPLALIVISVIMGAASIQVVVQSVEALITNNVDPHVNLTTLIIMIVTVVSKFGLMLVCCSMAKQSSNINVLMQDHRNDCISNTVAIACAFLATRYWVYLDPIAAIVVSFYIIATWMRTGFKHVAILSGKTASPEIINRIVKVCVDHRPKVLSVDTIFAYHFGLKYLVEVHVVLDENITLKEAHDISEPLQRKIEHLPYVERAFVHVDYDTTHKPEDEHKIV